MRTAALEKIDPEEKAMEALLLGFNLHGTRALRLLRRVAERVGETSTEEDAFERVRLRSIGAEAELYAEEGGMVSDSGFAKLLRVKSRQTVHNYREAGKIFSVVRGQHTNVYPVWQIHDGALLRGLADILKVLQNKRISATGILLFFLTPAEALDDERPLDLLRRGETEEVLLHAERYGFIGS